MYPPRITIYSQPTCQACQRLKAFLKSKSIEYSDRDITKDAGAFEELQALGFSTTPVIRIGNQTLAGFDQGRIEELLEAQVVSKNSQTE